MAAELVRHGVRCRDSDLPRGFTSFSVPRDNDAPDFLVAIPLPDPQRYRVTMLAPPELLARAEDAGPKSAASTTA
jgi:hypothetical protein